MKDDGLNDGIQTWNSHAKSAPVSPDNFDSEERKIAYAGVTRRACIAILTEDNGASALDRRKLIAETIVHNANEVGYEPKILALLSLPGIENMTVVEIARILSQLKKVSL